MNSNQTHFFADVDLPFHVWVRERTGQGYRWVLRDTTAQHLLKDTGNAKSSGGAPGTPPLN